MNRKHRQPLLLVLFILTLGLPAIASAQAPLKDMYLENSMGALYQGHISQTSCAFLYIDVTAYHRPSADGKVGVIYINYYNACNGSMAGVAAGGELPAGVLTVTGNTVQINLPDLLALTDPYYLNYTDNLTVFPIVLAWEKTEEWRQTFNDQTIRTHLVQPDGIVNERYAERHTQFSANASGFLGTDGEAGYLAVPMNVTEVSEIRDGSVKTHVEDLGLIQSGAGALSNTIVKNSTGASYAMRTEDRCLFFLVSVYAYDEPSSDKVGLLDNLLYMDLCRGAAVQASGELPAEMLAVHGNTVELNIPDLLTLTDLDQLISNNVESFPVIATWERTNDRRQDHIETWSGRWTNPDGTTSSGKSTNRYTEFSASISGFIGAGFDYYPLPIPGAYRSGAASMISGAVRLRGTLP